MARHLHVSMTTSRCWRLALTLITLTAIVASACAPAAPPPAPTTAPAPAAKPAAAPTTAPAAAATTAPAPAATTAPAAAPTTAPAAAATTAPAPKPGEVLKVVLGAEPTSLDPSIDTLKSSTVIQNTILETLGMNTPEGKYIPWLVESYEAIAPTTWRLKLKPGVKFHNGEPFNAESVIFSFDLFIKTTAMPRGWFSHVDHAEKVDDLTVDVITKAPSGIFGSSLSYLYVFPPKYYQEDPQRFGKKPVGTGAYKFVEWTPGIVSKVVANPDYWGKKPAIGEINFRWAAEASSRVAMIETGEVQIAQNIPPVMVERVEKSGTARIEAVKSIRKVFLMINIYSGPTKDVRVRKALNHAIDVDGIIKTLFRGRAYGRDKGMILEGLEGYQGDKVKAFTFDPELAKKLLAEAGFPNGFEMDFWHPIGRYMLDKESSEAMAGQLAKVGIKAKLQGMESGGYFAKLSSEKVLGVQFFACGILFLNPGFCSVVHHKEGSAFGYGSDARTNELLNAAYTTVDDAKRAKLYQDLENYIFNEQVSWVWLWHQQDIYAASNKLNWKARYDELITFEQASWK